MFKTPAQALRITVHIRSKGYSAARLFGAPIQPGFYLGFIVWGRSPEWPKATSFLGWSGGIPPGNVLKWICAETQFWEILQWYFNLFFSIVITFKIHVPCHIVSLDTSVLFVGGGGGAGHFFVGKRLPLKHPRKNPDNNISSVTNMLEDLGWRTLEQRRIDSGLAASLGGSSLLTLTGFCALSCAGHVACTRKVHTSLSSEYLSFFSGTIIEWNNLPASVFSEHWYLLSHVSCLNHLPVY